MKILWSPSAVRSLQQISDYIARDKPAAALRWMEEVRSKVARLKKFPTLGRMVPELGRQEVREILISNYRIIYRLGPTIAVLAIFHAAKPLTRPKS